MANWASVSYAIEGSRETLQKIEEAILMAMATKDNKYEEYKACKNLGITFDDTKVYLGGTIEDEPWYDDGGALHLYAEERWGLQDFNDLLEKHFPDIKVYWVVEEPNMKIYETNDVEGKYFSDRFLVDACIDGIYFYEYFKDEPSIYKWLSGKTGGRINSKEAVTKFNSVCENSEDDDNYIYINKFKVV